MAQTRRTSIFRSISNIGDAEHSGEVQPPNENEMGKAEVVHSHSIVRSNPDEPRLRYEHESSTIQLFYDLFFVANLTTFTGKHEVTDKTSKSLMTFNNAN
jgi:hypothetical protein